MFNINNGTGFQMTFANGYTVSVQFGTMNYCSNRFTGSSVKSPNAETALMDDTGFIEYDSSDVQGHRTPEQVLELLNFAANLETVLD